MADTRRLILVGAGGHARVVAETARACGWDVQGHVTPQEEDTDTLGPWLGNDDALDELMVSKAYFALGLGFVDAPGARLRAALLQKLAQARLASVVDPHACISPSAQIEGGAFVAPGAILATQSRVGMGAIINTGAIVDHDSQVGRNSHVATGARLAGGVHVGQDCLIGAGAVILQGLRIGDGAIVGAGAVVLRDVAQKACLVGNPARTIGGASR